MRRRERRRGDRGVRPRDLNPRARSSHVLDAHLRPAPEPPRGRSEPRLCTAAPGLGVHWVPGCGSGLRGDALMCRVEAPLLGMRHYWGRAGGRAETLSFPTFTWGPSLPKGESGRGGHGEGSQERILANRPPSPRPQQGRGSFPGSPGAQGRKRAGFCSQTSRVWAAGPCAVPAQQGGEAGGRGLSEAATLTTATFLGQRWASNIWCIRKVNEKQPLGLGPDQRCRRMPQWRFCMAAQRDAPTKENSSPRSPREMCPLGRGWGCLPLRFVCTLHKETV